MVKLELDIIDEEQAIIMIDIIAKAIPELSEKQRLKIYPILYRFIYIAQLIAKQEAQKGGLEIGNNSK